MNPQWTKGPWYYAEDTQGKKRVYSGSCEIVRALSTHGMRKVLKAERTANANLIAAAPSMYEALAAARRELALAKNNGFKASPVLIIDIEAALKLARGESL